MKRRLSRISEEKNKSWSENFQPDTFPRRHDHSHMLVYATTFHESPKVKVSVYVAKDIHSYSLTHSIHVWYMYLHEWLICMVNVGVYTYIPYMDGMVWGIYPKYIHYVSPVP